jgi:glycosyltransferase involved in cell wall biosynthesis
MTAPERLWIVHTESSCGWGGQEIRILTEAVGLSERGHRLTLLCPPEAPIAAAAETRGIAVVRLPIARKNPACLLALRRWLKGHADVDVLNTHSSTDSWLAALACATLSRAPPIVRTRHVSTHVKNDMSSRWLYRRAASHIVTAGLALREQLHRENGIPLAHMTSVPTGIDLERFRPRSRADACRSLDLDPARHYLGIVATLRNWKGHVYLLEAFAALAPTYPEWDLLIVGDGPQRRNLERAIATQGLGKRVFMPGNREDVETWFNAFSLFVLPSYGEEGVSQSVMQAMASGLPVVSTTVGATREAVDDGGTGLLVPPRDAGELRSALATLMQDPGRCARFGAAGRQRAEQQFGIAQMLDRMESIFRRIAREAR